LVVFTRKTADTETGEPFPIVRGLIGVWASDERTISNWPGRVDIWHVMNGAWAWLALHHENVMISIHGNDFLNPNAVAGFGLKSRLCLPFSSRLDFYLSRWRTPRVMRRAFPVARHIIANSRYVESLFLQRNPKCRGKTSVGHVGVAKRFFGLQLAPPPDRNRIRLITVCRLSEARKNVDLVIRALGQLKDRYSFTYTVVGDGDLLNTLQELSHELGLAKRVTFTGRSTDAELVALLSESDLFILTSTCSHKNVEGFGIVYLEANACGVPVLAMRSGGAVEAVKEGITGMFVDDLTVSAIGRTLSRYFNGEVGFDREACRSFAQSFTWDRVADHVAGSYSSVLEETSGRF